MKNKKILHLDMDGVIADLFLYIDYYYDINKKTHPIFQVHKFYRLVKNDPNIFLNIPPKNDAFILVDFLIKWSIENNYEIEILTAIPFGFKKFKNQIIAHKKSWLNKYFPHNWKFKIGPKGKDKYKHANTQDILIDDMKINIRLWEKAGGIGILHKSAQDTIHQLMLLKL